MFDSLRSQRLLALFATGWLALNLPLLSLWDRDLTFAGIPLLPAALFGGWALLIGLAAWINEGAEREPSDDAKGP